MENVQPEMEAALTAPVFKPEEKEISKEQRIAMARQARRNEKGQISAQVQGQRGIKPDAKQMFKIRQMMEREAIEMVERTKIQQGVNGHLA